MCTIILCHILSASVPQQSTVSGYLSLSHLSRPSEEYAPLPVTDLRASFPHRTDTTVIGCSGFHGDCLTLTKIIDARLKVGFWFYSLNGLIGSNSADRAICLATACPPESLLIIVVSKTELTWLLFSCVLLS